MSLRSLASPPGLCFALGWAHPDVQQHGGPAAARSVCTRTYVYGHDTWAVQYPPPPRWHLLVDIKGAALWEAERLSMEWPRPSWCECMAGF